MVVLDSLALAITISNDLAMPLLLRRSAPREQRGAEGDIGALVLWVRRIAIVGVLALGFVYERLAGEAALVSIGLLSFAAVAQIAPAFLGGLFWRRGTARGAVAGMTAGSLAWIYLLLLPSIAPRARDRGLFRARTAGDRLAEPRRAGLVRADRAGRRRRPFARRQYRRLRRLLADPPADRARAHAGERLRRRRRQAAGVPAVALVDDRRRTRGGGRPLSRRGAGASRLLGLHARERARLRSCARRRAPSSSAMRNSCCRRPSAPRPRARCCRCCSGRAPCRASRR